MQRRRQLGLEPRPAEMFGKVILSIGAQGMLMLAFMHGLRHIPSHNTNTATQSMKWSGCNELLHQVELNFDRRRSSRRQYLATNRSRHIYPEKRVFDMFEPEANCFTDERFGSLERYTAFDDGPKFVCGVDYLAAKSKTDEGCLVYSIGSNNEIDFEIAVNQFMGCEIHTFDPTLSKPFIGGEYATFHEWGLGKNGTEESYNGKNWTSKSLEQIVNELGHENRTIDILKIDCEGCEYDVLPPFFDLMVSRKIKVDQVQVEMHRRQSLEIDEARVAAFFLAADRADLRIFHKERNNWGCDGYFCVEYALARGQFLREVNKATVCPE